MRLEIFDKSNHRQQCVNKFMYTMPLSVIKKKHFGASIDDKFSKIERILINMYLKQNAACWRFCTSVVSSKMIEYHGACCRSLARDLCTINDMTFSKSFWTSGALKFFFFFQQIWENHRIFADEL